MTDEKTKGVETLLGNPKKAVIAMAIPMIVGLIAQSANNLIDAVWVSGLGSDALAAVGFVFPLFFILIGIGNGIGIGASSAVARHIGRGDKEAVDRTAMQGIVLLVVLAVIVMIFMLVFMRPILTLLGVGDTLELCASYATPIFLSTVILLLNGYLVNMIRSEGASTRAMISQIVASGINIILDPFFIYSDVFKEVFNLDLGFSFGLGLGMAGAAWATVIAISISLLILLYWYFIKGDTYVKIRSKYIPLDKETDKDILRVGVPASLEMIVMSLISMVMNVIIVSADKGTDGVAIFSSTWRLIQILMIPLMAIGSAVVPILAAGFGAKRYDKMHVAYVYSAKLCVIIQLVLVTITVLTAEFLVVIFTYSDGTAGLKDDMVSCLRILSLFLPFASWGFVAVGLFQSIGMGMKSFICTVVRNGLQIPAGLILLTTVGTFISIVWGVVLMEILGSILAGVWSYALLRGLVNKYVPVSKEDESARA